jgi:hypothetical protein
MRPSLLVLRSVTKFTDTSLGCVHGPSRPSTYSAYRNGKIDSIDPLARAMSVARSMGFGSRGALVPRVGSCARAAADRRAALRPGSRNHFRCVPHVHLYEPCGFVHEQRRKLHLLSRAAAQPKAGESRSPVLGRTVARDAQPGLVRRQSAELNPFGTAPSATTSALTCSRCFQFGSRKSRSELSRLAAGQGSWNRSPHRCAPTASKSRPFERTGPQGA